jgi:hypothetical protein
MGSTFQTVKISRSKTLLRANVVTMLPEPVQLPSPDDDPDAPNKGKLILRKENGAVKGFEYQCPCGKKDYFVCE